MDIEAIVYFINQLIFPSVGIGVAVFSVWALFRSQSFKIKAGSLEVSSLNRELSEIRERIANDLESAAPSERQFALLKEYHAQGLAQSKVSFWFSLMFAALGFLMILYSIIFYLGVNTETGANELNASTSILNDAQKPIFALIAGTVVEAVAALFFVQSNKARQLMADFFDKARMDRKLDESLVLASQVEDPMIAARLKAYLAISFADVEPSGEVLQAIVMDAIPSAATGVSQTDTVT